MPSLIVETSGARCGGPITSRVLIGRLPTNGILVPDTRVSRLHAWIDCDLEGLYYVADCGSLTGTRVNSQPIGKRAVLRDGDVIGVGQAQITFRESNDLPPGTEPLNLAGRPPNDNVDEAGVLFECVCGAPAWFKSTAIGQMHKCRHCGKLIEIPGRSGVRAKLAGGPSPVVAPVASGLRARPSYENQPSLEQHGIAEQQAAPVMEHGVTDGFDHSGGFSSERIAEHVADHIAEHGMTDALVSEPATQPLSLDHGVTDEHGHEAASRTSHADHDAIFLEQGLTDEATQPIEPGLTDQLESWASEPEGLHAELGLTDERINVAASDSHHAAVGITNIVESDGQQANGSAPDSFGVDEIIEKAPETDHGLTDEISGVVPQAERMPISTGAKQAEHPLEHGISEAIEPGIGQFEVDHDPLAIDDAISGVQAELASGRGSQRRRATTPEFLPEEPPVPPLDPQPVTERQSVFARTRPPATPHPMRPSPGQQFPAIAEPDQGTPPSQHPFEDVFDEHGIAPLEHASGSTASPHIAPPAQFHPYHEEASVHGKDCSVCHTAIVADEATTTCPSCGLSFHAECWQENQGCSAYGCPQVGVLSVNHSAGAADTFTADHDDLIAELPEEPEGFPWEYVFLVSSVLGTLLGLVVFGTPALVSAIGAFVYRIWFFHRSKHHMVLLVAIIVAILGVFVGIAASYYWWFGGF